MIGSRLSGAYVAPRSQVQRSQAQRIHLHGDWLLICMLVVCAGKLIGWPTGCTAHLYFAAATHTSRHAASQTRQKHPFLQHPRSLARRRTLHRGNRSGAASASQS